MLKKVRFDKSDIGDCFCMSVPVEANSKEQALNRFVRYCKMSKDIKYLGDTEKLNSIYEDLEFYSFLKNMSVKKKEEKIEIIIKKEKEQHNND